MVLNYIDSFYSDKSYYKRKKSNNEIQYSTIEKEKIKLFQDRTAALKSEREQLFSEIRMLNQLINSGAKDEIKKLFNSTADLNNNYLPKIFNQMDFDDIHWFKKEALFNIKKDNGDLDVEYSLKISLDTVTFEYALKGCSSLAEGKSLYPILNFSEYSFAYILKFKNGPLVFEKMMSAG